MSPREAVIVEAVRTPIGRRGGALAGTSTTLRGHGLISTRTRTRGWPSSPAWTAASWPAPTSRPTSRVTRLAKEIKERRVRDVDGFSLSDGVHAVLRDVEIYKPIIAAVGGPCVAGGMEMLGGTDIRIATPDATFGVFEPARGLFAGGGTTARLPRQIAYPAAMEFLLPAERFSAEDALRMGLLNRIVPERSLLDEAYVWARRIAKNAPLAVRATKESVLRGRSAGR